MVNRNFMVMADKISIPKKSRPLHALRNNGPDELALERYKLRELAEGWPCYRDACKWTNFESFFGPDAHVHTTWSEYRLNLDGNKTTGDKDDQIYWQIKEWLDGRKIEI
ncbi:catabolic 3-dehydroquinase [Fusarium proliferatum]|nr:catabolic 3-dehydroquinase [Fusarium proliferatum]